MFKDTKTMFPLASSRGCFNNIEHGVELIRNPLLFTCALVIQAVKCTQLGGIIESTGTGKLLVVIIL